MRAGLRQLRDTIGVKNSGVISASPDWFTGLSTISVIGQSDYFGFSFTTLNCKPP